jgi:hypothetical protein
MGAWKSERAWWILATLASVPASAFLWFVGGMAACGGEVYETPPGSIGDSFCGSVVDPVLPWVSIASIPVWIAAVGGVTAIRLRSRRLLFVALTAPFVIVGVGTLVALAVL